MHRQSSQATICSPVESNLILQCYCGPVLFSYWVLPAFVHLSFVKQAQRSIKGGSRGPYVVMWKVVWTLNFSKRFERGAPSEVYASNISKRSSVDRYTIGFTVSHRVINVMKFLVVNRLQVVYGILMLFYLYTFQSSTKAILSFHGWQSRPTK